MKNTKSTIPKQLREDLSKDPEYTYCCVTGEVGTSSDPIEWHHNLRFAGKNVQRRFCILPILRSVHYKADTHETRERLNWIMWNRASVEELQEFDKAIHPVQELQRLNAKFGPYIPVSKKVRAGFSKVHKEKKYWYPLQGDLKTRVLRAIEFHRLSEGIIYSPSALVELAIAEHCDEVERLQEEELTTAPGTVY